LPERSAQQANVTKTRIFIATMTAIVACIVILWATFVDTKLLSLATAMVPLLTALCSGMLATEYLERRAETKAIGEGAKANER
jgi:hypothetical protein